MTVIHSENILLENIYVNSTDYEHAVDFDFSSLNVRKITNHEILLDEIKLFKDIANVICRLMGRTQSMSTISRSETGSWTMVTTVFL